MVEIGMRIYIKDNTAQSPIAISMSYEEVPIKTGKLEMLKRRLLLFLPFRRHSSYFNLNFHLKYIPIKSYLSALRVKELLDGNRAY